MSVLAFFGTPIGRWIVILLLVFAAASMCELDGMRRQSDRDAKAEMAREREQLAAEARVVAAKNDGLRKLRQEYDARVAEDEKHLKEALARAAAAIDHVKKEAAAYVADTSSRVCPSVTVGYVVFRSRVSDIANGRPPAAAVPAPDAAAAPAGVSLHDLAVSVDAPQAAAFAACRERDAAWEKHVDELEKYAAKAYELLRSP